MEPYDIVNEVLNKKRKTLTEIMSVKADAIDFLTILSEKYMYNFKDNSINFFLFVKNIDVVLFLIELGADINNGLNNGTTALSYIAHDGNERLIKAMLDIGAIPDKFFWSTIEKTTSKEFVESLDSLFSR